jgi:hypothetical protein
MSAATLAMDLRELSPAELTELDAACPGLYADDIAAERPPLSARQARTT